MSLEETKGPAETETVFDENEDLDTFDDMSTSGIDDMNYEGETESINDDQYDKGQTKQLDDQEDYEESEGDEDEEEVEEEEEGSTDQHNDEEAEEDNEEGEEVETEEYEAIEGRFNGEKLGIPSDTEFRLKVDGKNEYPTLKALKENYSGKVSWDKKFSELDNERREYKSEFNRYQEEKGHIKGILEDVSSVLDDPNAHPIDGFYRFLDMTGRNSLDFHKKLMNSVIGEASELSVMDEVEQKLYWTQKDNEFLQKRQESLSNQSKATVGHQERVAKIDRMREAQGISEDEFVEAVTELRERGYDLKDLTPEQVCGYAGNREHIQTASSIVEGFVDDLDDSDVDEFISGLAKVFREFPDVEEDQAISLIAKRLGYDMELENEDIENLRKKNSRKQPKESRKNKKRYESPDDEVEYFDTHYF